MNSNLAAADENTPITVTPNFATPGQNISIEGSGFQEETRVLIAGGGAFSTKIFEIPRLAGVLKQGDYAYVIADNDGLYVVDVSNMDSPKVLGYLNIVISGFADFSLKDHFIYVLAYDSAQNHGLSIIDIQNPLSPSQISTFNIPLGSKLLEVSGDYAYVYAKDHSLLTIDISNPLTPTLALSLPIPEDQLIAIAIDGNYAYLSQTNFGLKIFDISNPLSPQLIGTKSIETSPIDIASETPPNDIAIKDNYAYIIVDHGLEIFDVTNPQLPVRINGIDLLNVSGESKISLAESYAYINSGFSGLYVINISDPVFSFLVGLVPTSGAISKFIIEGDFAYLSNTGYQKLLQIIDISQPQPPNVYARLETSNEGKAVKCQDSLCYVADEHGFYIFDVSNPHNPTRLSNLDLGDRSPIGLEIAGNYAYVTARTNNSYINFPSVVIDISDPTIPQIKSSFRFGGGMSLRFQVILRLSKNLMDWHYLISSIRPNLNG